jgi:hypothetical protein
MKGKIWKAEGEKENGYTDSNQSSSKTTGSFK